MKDRKHPQRRKQIWKSQITSFFICDQDVPKMLVSDVLYVRKSHIIFFPPFACLAGEFKKRNNATEMWQSFTLFHHGRCSNWDSCMLNNIKKLRLKVLMVDLWCHSSHWKCCLGKAMLRDTSSLSFWTRERGKLISKSRIRNERRRKHQQLLTQQSNVDGKHPCGRRKGFFSC